MSARIAPQPTELAPRRVGARERWLANGCTSATGPAVTWCDGPGRLTVGFSSFAGASGWPSFGIEATNTSERVANPHAYLRKIGRWSGGKPPFGCLPGPNPDGPGWVLVADPVAWPIVVDATSSPTNPPYAPVLPAHSCLIPSKPA